MIYIGIFSESTMDCISLIRVIGRYNLMTDRPFFHWDIYDKEEDWLTISGLDLIIVRMGGPLTLDTLRKIRIRDAQVELVIISDDKIPAKYYIDPEIRPLLLLDSFLDEESLMHPIHKLWRYLYQKKESESFSHRFFLGEKSIQRIFPYSSIYYFESRNKRIVMKTEKMDYEFYDSFLRMEQILPGEFIRCHRGFIVNVTHILHIDYGRHGLELDDHTFIPISKKYRRQLESKIHV